MNHGCADLFSYSYSTSPYLSPDQPSQIYPKTMIRPAIRSLGRTRALTFRASISPSSTLSTFTKPSKVTQSRMSSTQTKTPCASHRHTSPHLPSKIPNTPILLHRTIRSLRTWRRRLLHDHRVVGLVPTMGALHEGHLSLIRLAARECHAVVVSHYVNPAQFGVKEDLASYPSTWDSDMASLAALDRELAEDGNNLGRIAAVFAPQTEEMYPSGFPGQEVDSKGSFVTVTPVGEVLEGKSRPTFFRGVATVCMKLFNVVQPERVYFGQKDVQQTVVIKKMVKDFLMPLDVVVGETMREGDGLAMSSRNVYLGERRRKVATVLYKALRAAEGRFAAGQVEREQILGAARRVVDGVLEEQMALKPEERVKYEVDYISLADPDTMGELQSVDKTKGGILSGAIKMFPVDAPQEEEDLGHSGGPAVRLIDNIILRPSSAS